ncbi:AAA family ATPase [Candidatus Uhrbacteria bacterium]|nr:AAA family ATPase [Candidatus Uhrbacteria bacterium]
MSAESGQPRAVEQAGAGAEHAGLPELELKVLRRSEQPITKEGAQTRTLEGLRPWHNYTIVTLEGSDTIKIFDEDARPVEDFVPPISSKSIVIKWEKLQGRLGGGPYITRTSFSRIPRDLRDEAKKKLKDRDEVSVYGMMDSMMPSSHFEVSADGKYIVLFSKETKVYVAFRTQSEVGVLLAPRNWVRIDPHSGEADRDEVGTFAELLQSEFEGYKPLNDQYAALVTDVGISIVNKDAPKGAPVFSDRTPSVERNVVVDPVNPKTVYYCASSNPVGIARLELGEDPKTWSPVIAKFPKPYAEVRNLQLDPSGNFFLFYSKDELVVLTKEGLEEVKRMPKLTQVNFDEQSRIRAVDADGHLVVMEANFGAFAEELDKRRIARLAAGIRVADIFDVEVARKREAAAKTATLEYLQPLRAQYEVQFQEVLTKTTTHEGVRELRVGLAKLRDTLHQQGLKPNEVVFILEGLEAPVLVKEKEFAAHAAHAALALVRAKLGGGLSIASISEARTAMETMRAQEALLDEDVRREVRELAQELEERSLELFRQRGGEIIKDVQGVLERTRTDLEGFTSKAQMDDWLEFRYPQLKSRLGGLAKDCPLEADEAYKAIVVARTTLQEIATSFEEKFKREYAKVREKAAERIGAAVDTLEGDIGGLVDRLRGKAFADRRSAEDYLATSEAKRTLEAEIAALAGQNPDAAKELERALKVRLSNTLTEIERGARTSIAETGQQFVMFGRTAFPKWEAKVKERGERKVALAFEEDPRTHGPGVKAGDIQGDVVIALRNPDGSTSTVRLYEGFRDENEWRLGLLSYRGEAIPPSYVSAAEFQKFRKDAADWAQGEKSRLRGELEEKRGAMKAAYAKRKGATDEAWREEYRAALKDYAAFAADHHIVLLRRIDRMKAEPAIEHTNGKGFVPEWQSHWVVDRQTERDLEAMAGAFKMQLDLQEGLLNLKGHAGTGKDVRLKMFCALSGRPYFAIDGTKWTTEFELSEDVVLESKDGASQTVRVPSAVLIGITTPGAVVYFNEFNAMPEQAQIFLHALMDEKRSLTLKTSSGKVIRALPSVLLASSMNPGYPGTFEPQFATRSRMMSLEIGYPPLTRQPDAGDRNANPPYDSSEALRVARGVDSLADLTYEASLERNEFVKLWDKYVNGLETGAPDPIGTQRFDLDVILALIQFTDKLRADFIKIFEKTREARMALPVTQPMTGRELRRAAYALSTMTPEEKATANPEVVARALLERFFLTHIDKKDDQDKIRTAMATWTSKKRVRA